MNRTQRAAAELLRQASAAMAVRGRTVGTFHETTGAVCATGALNVAEKVDTPVEVHYLARRALHRVAEDYDRASYPSVNDYEYPDPLDDEELEAVRDDLDYAASLIERGIVR